MAPPFMGLSPFLMILHRYKVLLTKTLLFGRTIMFFLLAGRHIGMTRNQ